MSRCSQRLAPGPARRRAGQNRGGPWGRIRAKSEGLGLGIRFTFTLPSAAEADTLLPGSSSNSAVRGRQRVRVLAVDDGPKALRYLRDVLPSAGYAPIVSGDPADVPRPMAEHRPHLALLDVGYRSLVAFRGHVGV